MKKAIENEEKVTGFYAPGKNLSWKYEDYYKDTNQVIVNTMIEIQYSIEITFEGVAIWTGPNKMYSELLKYFQINSPTPQEAMWALVGHCEPKGDPSIPREAIMNASRNLTPDYTEIDKIIIGRILFQKLLIIEVWREFSWTKFYIKRVLKQFNSQLRRIRRDSQKYLNKKHKLNNEQLEALEDTIKIIKDKKFTVSDVHREFLLKDKTGVQVQQKTIYRRMRDNLGLTYKKWGLFNRGAEGHEKRQQIYTHAVLWAKLLSNDFHLVYIDEFKFLSESNTEYCWSKSGRSTFKFLNSSKFSMSFMIAFSSSKVEGIVGTCQTFNAKKFKKFVTDIFQDDSSNVFLIVDNSRIHTANIVRDLWKEQGILVVTIPAYSPFCNPCEKLILRIKSKARKLKMSGHLVTLQTFKKIIDEIKPASLQDCIKESLIETYYFIKNYS